MKKIQKSAAQFDNLKQDFLDDKKYSGTAEATLNGYRYQKPEAFTALSETDKGTLMREVAPLISLDDKDEAAKRFDNFVYGLVLCELEGLPGLTRAQRRLKNTASPASWAAKKIMPGSSKIPRLVCWCARWRSSTTKPPCRHSPSSSTMNR